MKKKLFLLSSVLLSFCFFFLFSCNNKANNSEHQAANPFDTTQTTVQTLNDEDRAKLSQAQGKKAVLIDNETLSSKIANSTGQLNIYCFWRLDNAESVNMVRAVNKLAMENDSTLLNVKLVHVSPSTPQDSINLFIRENQLTEETFVLDKLDKNMMAAKVKKDFLNAADLPIIVMVNKAEGLVIYYNKVFDEPELKAIVQPFLL
jgi:hypothetical protein